MDARVFNNSDGAVLDLMSGVLSQLSGAVEHPRRSPQNTTDFTRTTPPPPSGSLWKWCCCCRRETINDE